MSSETRTKVSDLLSGLEAELHDTKTALEEAQRERDAFAKSVESLDRTLTESSSELWRIPKGIIIESAESGRFEPRAIGFGEVFLYRRGVALVAAVGDSIPYDSEGTLNARLSDEAIFEVVTTGGKKYVALDPDEAASLVLWLAQPSGTPKGKR
jgi:hypothetical protein